MNRGETGIAMIMALLALLMLSTLGAGLVLTTSTEASIGGHFRDSAELRFAARAAASRALVDLSTVTDWDDVLSGAIRSSFADGAPGVRTLAANVTIDLLAIQNLANCGQPVGCTPAAMDAITAARPWGPNNPRWQLFAWGTARELQGDAGASDFPYTVVLVGDDGAENDGEPARDGTDAANPGSGRIVLRALAFGVRGHGPGLEMTLRKAPGGSLNVLSSKDLR